MRNKITEELCITLQSIRRKPEIGLFVYHSKPRPVGQGAVLECVLLDSIFTENLSIEPFEVNIAGDDSFRIQARKRTSEMIVSTYTPATNSYDTLFDGEPLDSTFEEDVFNIISNKQDLIVPIDLRRLQTPFFLLCSYGAKCFKVSLTLNVLAQRLCDFPDFISFENKHRKNLKEDYYAELIKVGSQTGLRPFLKIPFDAPGSYGVIILHEMLSGGLWNCEAFYCGSDIVKGGVLERRTEAAHSSGILKISCPIAEVINLGEPVPLS